MPGVRGFLVVFMCNHCPYVKHVAPALSQIGHDYLPRGIAIFGINSNDAEHYPDDSPEQMGQEAKRFGYNFPYLFDATQEVAKAYRAACTPDFFLFDSNRRLVYRGQMDDSRPGNGIAPSGKDLRTALDSLLNGKPIPAAQKPSIGCNIKWKSGNEPGW